MSERTRRGLAILAALLFPFIVGLLFTYELIRIPFPTDMAQSIAVGYVERPQRAPPQSSVPIQGQEVIPEELPSNPIPGDDTSHQRGQILFDIHCALCHGPQGHGDGPLAHYFARTPENLIGEEAAAEFDGSMYLVIQEGFGEMPSLAENLSVRERWDVINYIRTLAISEP